MIQKMEVRLTYIMSYHIIYDNYIWIDLACRLYYLTTLTMQHENSNDQKIIMMESEMQAIK